VSVEKLRENEHATFSNFQVLNPKLGIAFVFRSHLQPSSRPVVADVTETRNQGRS